MVGARPSFDDIHLLRTLLLLSDGPCGRKKLVEKLGIGEGSVRTIIKKLSGQNLIESSKQGHILTGEGEEFVQDKLKLFSRPLQVSLEGFLEGEKSLVVLKKKVSIEFKLVDLRDTALRAGANGAVILRYDGGIHFFENDMDLGDYPIVEAELGQLDLVDGDIIVISFSDSAVLAEDGALAIVEKIIKN